jgi:hypothetical protein
LNVRVRDGNWTKSDDRHRQYDRCRRQSMVPKNWKAVGRGTLLHTLHLF